MNRKRSVTYCMCSLLCSAALTCIYNLHSASVATICHYDKKTLHFSLRQLNDTSVNISVYLEYIYKASDARTLLVLFTSFKNEPRRRVIQENTLRNWASFRPFVQPVLFDSHSDKRLLDMALSLGWHILPTAESHQGLPYLKQLFKAVAAKYKSTFYGFSNGDILYEYGMIDTLVAVRDALRELKQALVIGRRTNVSIGNSTRLFDPRRVTSAARQNGTLFQHDAEDYFFIAHNDFIWEQVPDIVIGRPGYDNFLVAKAWRAGVPVIDATNTLVALHQSGNDGAFTWRNQANIAFNWDAIGQFNFAQGATSHVPFETRIVGSKIEIWHRIIKGDPRIYQVNAQC